MTRPRPASALTGATAVEVDEESKSGRREVLVSREMGATLTETKLPRYEEVPKA